MKMYWVKVHMVLSMCNLSIHQLLHYHHVFQSPDSFEAQ